MRVTLTTGYVSLTRVVLLAVTVALVPWPAVAADGPSSTPHPTGTTATNTTTLRTAVAREAARVPLAHATTRRSDQGPNGFTTFFKSRPGQIALTVMAVGTGYAIYSTQHDRIKSPGKK